MLNLERLMYLPQYYAVIGFPIAHSQSPVMQQAAFAQAGIYAKYESVNVAPHNLAKWVKLFRAKGGSGFNVTIPHKVTIIDYIDEVSASALACGAVNTVKNQAGKLIGYNTDGNGFLKALLNYAPKKVNVNDSVLLLGAGGAAKGIYTALINYGFNNVVIANRTLSTARQLTNRVYSLLEAEQKLAEFKVIINTTSVGMGLQIGTKPIELAHLQPGAFVSDIIYNPRQTKLLQEARLRTNYWQNGIDMFVYQGAQAFKIWTNKEADTSAMKAAVIRSLVK